MQSSSSSEPYMIEKIVSALSYLTMGMAGFIWLILGLFTKASLRPFLKYHIYQSIFISIVFVILSYLLGFIVNILSFIPFINRITAQFVFLLNMPFLFGMSVIQTCIYVFLTYLAVTSFMGKYSYIPYVSDIIGQNVS